MATMGRYCKAYTAKDFRAFKNWREAAPPRLDGTNGAADSPGAAHASGQRADDDILYLQEDLVVTDGIFKDEHIVFSDPSDEWRTFCHQTLAFGIPDWLDEGEPAIPN